MLTPNCSRPRRSHGGRVTATRSDRVVRALAARGGRCTVDVLQRDLALRKFPVREFRPAVALAVMDGRVIAEDGDIIALTGRPEPPTLFDRGVRS